jgi:hypothetical protein
MLDVHAPHDAVHTWKSFFIHLVTIVIGLLIAVGLEQSVEWLHHRHQLREARRELSTELEANRRLLKANQDDLIKVQVALAQDMVILREHQKTHAPLSGPLDYSWEFWRTPDAAWQTVKQNGTLSLMSYEEQKAYVFVYTVFGNVMDAATAFNTAIEVAGAIARRAPGESLSPQDIEELITATSDTQGKAAFTQKLLEFEGRGLDRVEAAAKTLGYKE